MTHCYHGDIICSVLAGFCRRSPETPEANVEFDASLLEETDNLPANEILWNTLTADSLQAM